MKRQMLRIAALSAIAGGTITVGIAGSQTILAADRGAQGTQVKASPVQSGVQADVPVSGIWHPAQAALELDQAAQQRNAPARASAVPEVEVKRDVAPSAAMAGWTPVMTEGFEGTWPASGWSVSSNFTYGGVPITWGPATYHKRSGSKAGWPHASVIDPEIKWTLTAPSGYTIDSWAIYGPFSLSDATDARLTFFLSYQHGAGDSTRWMASIDGSQFYGYGYTGGSNWSGWTQITFDLKSVPTLGNLCGRPSVYIALLYQADASQDSNEGAYVDDVLLEKYTQDEHCFAGCGSDYDYGPYVPGTTYTSHSGSFTAGGCRWYLFSLTAGNEYRFSFCEGEGTASGNTTLTLDGPTCSQLAYDDDTCGLLSQIIYSPPASGDYYLRVGTLGNDAALSYTLAYKGVPLPGQISGAKWSDEDGDHTWDAGEHGLRDWVIYLDLNNNGHKDEGEPMQTTGEDGSYVFTGLASGNYQVSEVSQPDCWTQTFPGQAQAKPGRSTIGDNLTAQELAALSMNVQDSPPKPPAGFERKIAATLSATAVTLSEVPTSLWSYGCSATSAGMIFGYYDRHGYPNMYTGPTNGGVAPLVNLCQGDEPLSPIPGSCSICATQTGFDGRGTRGHVDDYWISYNSSGPDPWEVNGWTQHAWEACTADYMGTNQWKWDYSSPTGRDANLDGATTFFSNGASKLYDFIPPSSYGMPQTEVCHGLRTFAESRGYTVVQNYTQGIDTAFAGGFTFNNYMAEIDAGRPVMIHLVGHSMVGVGYDSAANTVYLHDTWDNMVHTMTWGGSYYGMLHQYVTVIELASGCPSESHCVSVGPGQVVPGVNFGNHRECEETQACCKADHKCENLVPSACSDNLGGTPMGEGTTCGAGPGRCCAKPFADADRDDDVDMDDFALLQRCLTIDGGAVSDECRCFDTDGNNLIELSPDLQRFINCGTGPSVSATTDANPLCVDY